MDFSIFYHYISDFHNHRTSSLPQPCHCNFTCQHSSSKVLLLLQQLLQRNCLMGGHVVRYEPKNTVQVRSNPYVWQVFLDGGWHVYFERLQGFDEAIIVEFALNLDGNHSRVHGLDIPITEEVISTDNGLLLGGQKWFSRKYPLQEFPKLFLQAGETRVQKSRGYDQKSLPHPCAEIAYFFIRYITCEVKFSTLFNYHFNLLSCIWFQHAKIHSLDTFSME